MKLALFADLHGNLEAVETCVDHARRHGAGRFAFLGDLVGYNADPAAVVELVRRMLRDENAIAIQGNHDAAAAGEDSGRMNEAARAAIEWTRRQLSSAQLHFLAKLPLTAREGQRMLFVHANAAAPGRWGYIHDNLGAAASMEAAGAGYVFCGHVHEPVLYYMGTDRRPQAFQPTPGVPIPVSRHRRWLAIVGACGQPRDGNPAAAYALMDDALQLLTFQRVPYDHAAAARKVRQAGLPEEFARRLETGC